MGDEAHDQQPLDPGPQSLSGCFEFRVRYLEKELPLSFGDEGYVVQVGLTFRCDLAPIGIAPPKAGETMVHEGVLNPDLSFPVV